MKKQLFLYLFILSSLIGAFTYMYFSKKEAAIQKKYEVLSKKFKDTLVVLENNMSDANYFSLENNDNAQEYFQNYNTKELISLVKNQLMNYNDDKEGNKYVDQPKMGAQKFIINRIKLLNHRWIIADYSNGSLWGEVLLKYFVNEDETVSFEIVDTYLYPKQKIE